MLCISRNAGKYKPGTNARAWVMAIARNLSINALKAGKNVVSCDDMQYDEVLNDNSFSGNFQAVIIEEALHTLSQDEQMIVKLNNILPGFLMPQISICMNVHSLVPKEI